MYELSFYKNNIFAESNFFTDIPGDE